MDEEDIIRKLAQDFNSYSELAEFLAERAKVHRSDEIILHYVKGKRDLVMGYIEELTANNPNVHINEHQGSIKFKSCGRKGEKLNEIETTYQMITIRLDEAQED